MTAARHAGDLGDRPAVSSFEFHLSDLDENRTIHGLGQRAIWPYGGLRGASGTRYVLERKFVHQMSGGLWALSDSSGTMTLLPKSAHSARGELRREFSPGHHVYRDHLMAKLGEHAPPDEQPLHMDVTDGELIWNEGELCDLRGTAIGPGLQFFVLENHWPLAYLSRMYQVSGTAMGEPVDGVVWFDHGYWRERGEWKEMPFYTQRQVAWNVFWNEFDDGTHEWGHIVRGIDGMAVCMVGADDGPVLTTAGYDAEFELDDQDYVTRAVYRAGDLGWEFTSDPAGHLTAFNKARWGGYRAQAGTTTRIGETRTVTNSFTWLECFADRIRHEGLTKH